MHWARSFHKTRAELDGSLSAVKRLCKRLQLNKGITAEVIRRRYERASTIITSNRALAEWPPLFKDELLASAALDRLLHHAHIVEITGHSYRNPPRGRDTKARAA